jgi:hypothetical protein
MPRDRLAASLLPLEKSGRPRPRRSAFGIEGLAAPSACLQDRAACAPAWPDQPSCAARCFVVSTRQRLETHVNALPADAARGAAPVARRPELQAQVGFRRAGRSSCRDATKRLSTPSTEKKASACVLFDGMTLAETVRWLRCGLPLQKPGKLFTGRLPRSAFRARRTENGSRDWLFCSTTHLRCRSRVCCEHSLRSRMSLARRTCGANSRSVSVRR